MRYRPLLFTAAIIIAACDNSTDVDEHISGIWHAHIPNFGDSLDVRLSFSFDQVSSSEADGGVRVVITPDPAHRGLIVLKVGHSLDHLEHTEDGVEIIGSVDLGEPFGELSFDALLEKDNDLTFTYQSDAGSGSAAAEYGGEYVRGQPGNLARGVSALIAPADYIGRYHISYASGNTFGFLGGSMDITSAGPDGFGGVLVQGRFNNNGTPYFPNTTPTVYGDAWAGSLVAKIGSEVRDNQCSTTGGYASFIAFPFGESVGQGPYKVSPDPDCTGSVAYEGEVRTSQRFPLP